MKEAPATTDSHEYKLRDCQDQKVIYDKCFRNWYRYSYLEGDLKDPCEEYFKVYNACLRKSLEYKGLGDLLDAQNPIWDHSSSSS